MDKYTEIIEFIINYMKNEFNIEADIGRNTNIQDIGMDSLDIVNLLFAVQEKFGVEIPDEDMEEKGLQELDRMARYIQERLS